MNMPIIIAKEAKLNLKQLASKLKYSVKTPPKIKRLDRALANPTAGEVMPAQAYLDLLRRSR